MSPTETYQKVSTGWKSLRSAAITPFGGAVDPPPDPGNFTLFKDFDLTSDEGWSQSSGNRALDSSVNRAAQTTFGPGGMTITAERATTTSTIYSSDAMGRFAFMPNYHAIEADITMGDYLGVGCFPALWARPNGSGQGEIDYWEIMGGQPVGNSHYKGTMILTNSPTTYNVGQKAIQYDRTGGVTVPGLGVMRTYRVELIPGQISFKIDGVLQGIITKAQVDAQSASGQNWDNNFGVSGQKWYPRFTYQFGPPTDGRSFNAAGAVPGGWLKSTMTMSRLVCYEYTGP